MSLRNLQMECGYAPRAPGPYPTIHYPTLGYMLGNPAEEGSVSSTDITQHVTRKYISRKSTPKRGRGQRAHQTHPDRTTFPSPVAHTQPVSNRLASHLPAYLGCTRGDETKTKTNPVPNRTSFPLGQVNARERIKEERVHHALLGLVSHCPLSTSLSKTGTAQDITGTLSAACNALAARPASQSPSRTGSRSISCIGDVKRNNEGKEEEEGEKDASKRTGRLHGLAPSRTGSLLDSQDATFPQYAGSVEDEWMRAPRPWAVSSYNLRLTSLNFDEKAELRTEHSVEDGLAAEMQHQERR
ncbi:hypothetical protein B0H14DRAFT_2584267 [Mycena olivaceomarginata]|nr:hypothetical protein B0H14DRAFT_2584267 [Mycena olivaceomarginata]